MYFPTQAQRGLLSNYIAVQYLLVKGLLLFILLLGVIIKLKKNYKIADQNANLENTNNITKMIKQVIWP
jgi:hypothetical protein